MAKYGDIQLEETVFFLCDMQEKFEKAISHFNDIKEVCSRLINGSNILGIPLVVTEQYPSGLGHTIQDLKLDDHSNKYVFEKTDFTMMVQEVQDLLPKLRSGNVKHVVIFGIETHVCVQQTVLDLLKNGCEVYVVADATSSRSQMDRLFALQNFSQKGATVTTSEAILLQLIRGKTHPEFKKIQALIKEKAPTSGLHNANL